MLFGSKSTFYALYVRGDGEEQEIIAIKHGFSFLAFVFSMFWALFNRLWGMAAIGFLAILGLVILQVAGLGSEVTTNIGNIALNIWFGVEATRFKERKLVKDGYTLEDVVYAPDELAAKITAYERQHHPVIPA